MIFEANNTNPQRQEKHQISSYQVIMGQSDERDQTPYGPETLRLFVPTIKDDRAAQKKRSDWLPAFGATS